ncbi:hypothetical protein HAX54_039016 [Datura stramonium]|uniref:DUF4005 domain-containing protein n=1 Tax=Datura stramonium TaxID=4076 RepID=A0ABS8VNE2_DATST|nr:hypothetical protein [Datura stramonium]
MCAIDKELNGDEVAAKSPASHPTAVAAISHRDFHLDDTPSPTALIKASMTSAQSERRRRHSFLVGSSIRDDESLESSRTVPSYMAATESARARSRLPSPLGFEKNGTPEKGTVSSAKKRLSFSALWWWDQETLCPPKVDIALEVS